MKYHRFIAFIVIILFVFQCEKDLDLEPAVKTGLIEMVTARSAVVQAEIIDLGDGISDYGHCYRVLSTPTITDNKTSFGVEKKRITFSSELTDLEPGSQYKVRAYVISNNQAYYGEEITLETNDGIALVETGMVSNIGVRSAQCEGSVISSGGDEIIEKGFCWNQSSPVRLGSCTGRISANQGPGSFEAVLDDLQPGTSYFVNVYAITSVDTAYGIPGEFTTLDGIIKFDDIEVKDTSSYELLITFSVTDSGGDSIESLGLCFGQAALPDKEDNSVILGNTARSYTCSITDLEANTLYYIRPFGTNSVNTYYGSQITVRTEAGIGVSTLPATEISMSSALSGGQISDAESATISERGVCWSVNSNPTYDDNRSVSADGGDNYIVELTGLDRSTSYHIKAYILIGQSIVYGEDRAFITDDGAIVISTVLPGGITMASAVSGGIILDDGGDAVTERGVCWNTSANPTISDARTSDGSGTGSYSSAVSGLVPNTTYYLRAYATNSLGTSYGDQRVFTTLQTLSIPTVSTSTVSSITQGSAVSGGNVLSDGNSMVTVRGVCWSTSANPTTSNAHTSNGGGTGSYSSAVTGLVPNTTYYLRAYATNSQGTSYGDQRVFTTLQTLSIPTVSTSTVSSITQNTAVSGGYVSSDGNAAVTARGICWSTSANPTTSNAHTSNGSGTGSYTSSVSGLVPNTTYYLRAYATNSQGTSYGDQRVFTTLQTLSIPTVSTSTVSSITQNTAVSGGYVSSDGNAAVTARGVCWSTTANPTTSNAHTSNGSGTGSYTSSVSGLVPNTTYYLRAYATNSQGTSYGDQRVFTTLQALSAPTVLTSIASNITQTSAVSGGYVSSDGNAAVTARGVCWSTSTTSPTIYDEYTNDGSGTGSYTSYLSGLLPSTTYYFRAYATNSQGTSYGDFFTFTTADISYGSVSDYDGNTYRTVVIGSQTWMADNLATTHYSDGTALVDGTGAGNIQYSSDTKFWFVYNDDLSYKYTYGLLYSWAAARNGSPSSSSNPSYVQGVCPSGWHLPSKSEWEELFNYLGGSSVAGGKMKERGLWHWRTPNTAATNSSGFTSIPCGNRLANGFYTLDTDVNYWSSDFWATMLRYSKAEVYTVSYYGEYYGLNVRCVKN